MSIEFFVPCRLCLLGRYNDWAKYRLMNFETVLEKQVYLIFNYPFLINTYEIYNNWRR